MRYLDDNDGTPTVLRALRHVVIQLEGRGGLDGLVAEFSTLRAEVRAADEEVEEATLRRIVAGKQVPRLDKRVDKAAVRLSTAIRDDLEVERRDDVHLAVFPVAASVGTAGVATEAQSRFVTNAIEAARAVEGRTDKIIRRTDELEAAETELVAAKAALQAAKAVEEQKKAARSRSLERARAAYNLLHARLLTLLPNEKAWVNEVFL